MQPIFCAGIVILLILRGTSGDSVTQTEGLVILLEGEPLILNCTYQTSYTPYLFWYVQYENKRLELLLKSSTDSKRAPHHFQADLIKEDSTFHLKKSSVQVSDSATYYCVLSPQGYGKLTFGRGTSLVVHPYIPDPKPAVYQLTNSKSNNMSVCLFTDFDSRMNTSEVKKPTAIGTTTTVLDMRSTGSKSNGILTWTSSGDSSCNETFSLNNSYFFSSDSSCNAKLVEENFRTDWDMNFQNLSVMALRILFLKLTGFNLLMTLRLWSS